MLESLDGQRVGDYRLDAEKIGRARFFDQWDFALYLRNALGNRSDSPVFRGKFNAGRPSIYVPTWIDGEFVEDARIGDEVIVLAAGLAEEIAQKLGPLIPPGGRLWFAYEAFDGEGELVRETRTALRERVPLIVTPIGFLLFRADCWVGLRDWDIPEGGREGPRKMQGNKALNPDHARQRANEIVHTLEQFLHHGTFTETERRAQARARVILPALGSVAGVGQHSR